MTASDDARDPAARVDTLDYATPREAPARAVMRPNLSMLILGAALLLLSIASFGVLFENGSAEPYYGTIRKSDAVVQVGLGCVLIAFWICWCVALVALAWRGKVRRAWCTALLWAGMAIFTLVECVDGYLSDLITFQSTPSGPAGNAPLRRPRRPSRERAGPGSGQPGERCPGRAVLSDVAGVSRGPAAGMRRRRKILAGSDRALPTVRVGRRLGAAGARGGAGRAVFRWPGRGEGDCVR